MSKKIINNYPRKNTDWKYINYLESVIKELKEENKQLKENRRGLNKRISQLSNDLFWTDEELGQSDYKKYNLDKENKQLKEELRIEKEYSSKLYYDNLYLKHQKIPQLEGTIKYYKQSLL